MSNKKNWKSKFEICEKEESKRAALCLEFERENKELREAIKKQIELNQELVFKHQV